MSKRRFQFSLRSLLIVTTVLAVLTVLVANHLMVLIGIAVAIMWLLELAFFLYPYVDVFNDLRGPSTTAQLKRERTSEATEKHRGRSV